MTEFFTFLIISIILVLVILILTYFINIPTSDYEKHSAYECGFEPFGDARSFFDIHFYTIGLLFIIFDLEIVFLIPVVIDISNISLFGYINLIVFLLIVLIGFYYEWSIGLLNWLPQKISSNVYKNIHILIIHHNIFNLIYNIDYIFYTLVILIIISLLLTQLTNLIYRVINLASLSLLVVGTWVYFTDMTFIYIVYILAFIGAVIMLFLSVILMLPASAITQNKVEFKLIIFSILFENNNTFENVNIWSNFIILLILLLIFYLISNILDFSLNELYYGYTLLYKNIKLFILESRCQWHKQNNFNQFFKWQYNYWYTKWIIINAFFGFGIPIEVLKSGVIKDFPLQATLVLVWHDILYYLYCEVESRLYNTIGKQMYIKISPVWGKTFFIFEKSFAPARYLRDATFPIHDSKQLYTPAPTVFSLYFLLPNNISIPFILYFSGKSLLIRFINCIVFILNLLMYFLISIIYNLIIWLTTTQFNLLLNIFKQIILFSSLVFISLPIKYNSAISLWDNNSLFYLNLINNDSLLSIKYILYEDNSLFLLVSVIGLLVALIGSAVFTKHKK